MANVMEKIELLRTFRDHPEDYLPVTGQAWKVFPKKDEGESPYDDPQYNIGWNTGLLDGNRPYFSECWATGGITVLTYLFSADGLENADEGELVGKLTDAGLFRLRDPENPRASAGTYTEKNGKVFYSVNIVVGVEDEVYLDGGTVYPFGPLNEFNRGNPDH